MADSGDPTPPPAPPSSAAPAPATTDPTARPAGHSLAEQRNSVLAAIARAEAEVAAAAAAVQATAARLELLHEEREMNDLIAFNGGTWTVD